MYVYVYFIYMHVLSAQNFLIHFIDCMQQRQLKDVLEENHDGINMNRIHPMDELKDRMVGGYLLCKQQHSTATDEDEFLQRWWVEYFYHSCVVLLLLFLLIMMTFITYTIVVAVDDVIEFCYSFCCFCQCSYIFCCCQLQCMEFFFVFFTLYPTNSVLVFCK